MFRKSARAYFAGYMHIFIYLYLYIYIERQPLIAAACAGITSITPCTARTPTQIYILYVSGIWPCTIGSLLFQSATFNVRNQRSLENSKENVLGEKRGDIAQRRRQVEISATTCNEVRTNTKKRSKRRCCKNIVRKVIASQIGAQHCTSQFTLTPQPVTLHHVPLNHT